MENYIQSSRNVQIDNPQMWVLFFAKFCQHFYRNRINYINTIHGNHSGRFSRPSEINVSEILENFKEMFRCCRECDEQMTVSTTFVCLRF